MTELVEPTEAIQATGLSAKYHRHLARLEAEHERLFHEAQLAADTMFAQYQLSQILATHDSPRALAAAVLDELLHVCGAEGGAIWIADARTGRATLAARRGVDLAGVSPSGLADGDGPQRIGHSSWATVALDDGSRRVGLVALATPADRPLERAQLRFLALVRHELAVALRGAQLRESLALERAELSAIIEGASDAIVLVDDRRRVVRLNAAARDLLGVTPAGVIGRTCRDALGCAARDECAGGCPFERVLRTGQPVRGHERIFSSALGEPVQAVGNYALASRSAGGAAQAMAIFRDTTQLAQLAELRQGFVATISHELRTPLALITGYVETLLHLEPDPAEARGYLERISQATERLSQLVAQILDVAQLAAGQLVLERRPLDLGPILRAAAADLRVRHPALRMELDVADGLPPVEAEADRLRQVLDNLLGNAAKYSPPDCRVRMLASASADTLEVRVEDDGIGIPADERDLVFEQFHRARNVRESPLPGSGLGLTISRRIVEAHGGQLSIGPGRAGGTVALLRLPISAIGDGRTASVALPVGETQPAGRH